GAPAGGGRAPRRLPAARPLPQGRTPTGPAPRRRRGDRPPGDGQTGLGDPGGAGRGRGQRRRGTAPLRYLRGARRGQRRRRARAGACRDGRGTPGAQRRGGGAAHLPRRAPLVRLVRREAPGHRHRRGIPGDRLRHGRGAGRRGVAAAGRRPPHGRLAPRGPARRGRGARAAPPRAHRDRAYRRRVQPVRPPRPRRGHLQDVQAARPHRGRPRLRRGPLRAAGAEAAVPGELGAPARRHDGGGARRTPRRLRGARGPAAGRGAGRGGVDGPVRRGTAGGLPVGPARGRDPWPPGAHGRGRPAGLRVPAGARGRAGRSGGERGPAPGAVAAARAYGKHHNGEGRPPACPTAPRTLSLVADPTVRVPAAKVALSTASVYPESTATAFEIAARLRYVRVEGMLWTAPVSEDIEALRRLSDYHRVPVLAVHAPCLLITQRVWSTDPWTKLQRARSAAERLGADTVVVHPPFRWQRQYARDFVEGIWRMADETDVRFAVENMYPWRYRDREMLAYAPDWDVTR